MVARQLPCVLSHGVMMVRSLMIAVDPSLEPSEHLECQSA